MNTQRKASIMDRVPIAARMYITGHSRSEIASRLGVSIEAVRKYLKKANLICDQDNSTQKQEILSALACGWTWAEVAREMYCSKETISALVRKTPPQKFFHMPKPIEIEAEKNSIFIDRLEKSELSNHNREHLINTLTTWYNTNIGTQRCAK